MIKRPWFLTGYIFVVLVLLGVALYWIHQPVPKFDKYTVDIVTQNYGTTSKINVPQLELIEEDEFSIYTTTLDLKGNLIFITPSVLLNRKSNRYAVMTYRNLPVGNYNVVIHVDRQINPIRFVRQQFTLATLSVIGAPNVADDPTTKYVCPGYPIRRTPESVPVPHRNADPLLYNGA